MMILCGGSPLFLVVSFILVSYVVLVVGEIHRVVVFYLLSFSPL